MKLLFIILKNLDTQNMTSSSEQDNLDLLLGKETDSNCSNTQDGAQKDAHPANLPPLQSVTPSNLTNLNLTQLLALLQNSIQNQPNIDPIVATLPDAGQNKNTVNSTGENPKENGDNNEEDESLQDLTQEFERGDSPFIKN